MNMHGSRLLGFLFWATYAIAALACWLTTFQVFQQSDTPLVAGLAAASIDGVLALTLYIMGRTKHQDQRTVALFGTVMFAIFSGCAQVIHRFQGLGLVMPEWMTIISMFLLPASTTGGLVLLGVLKYFQPGNGGQGGNKPGPQQWQPSYDNLPQPRSQGLDPSRIAEPVRSGNLPSQHPAGGGNGNGKARVFPNDNEGTARLVPTQPDYPITPRS